MAPAWNSGIGWSSSIHLVIWGCLEDVSHRLMKSEQKHKWNLGYDDSSSPRMFISEMMLYVRELILCFSKALFSWVNSYCNCSVTPWMFSQQVLSCLRCHYSKIPFQECFPSHSLCRFTLHCSFPWRCISSFPSLVFSLVWSNLQYIWLLSSFYCLFHP